MTSPIATLPGTPRSTAAANAPRPALTVRRFILLGAAHAALGAFLVNSSLATPVAAIAMAAALALAIKNPENGPYAAAYAAGSELLWRMSEAGIPWESAKYVAILSLLSTLRRNIRWSPITSLGFAYFVLLLPGAMLTLQAVALNEARTRIAFNLSGPATVMASIVAFNCLPIHQIRPLRLLGAFLIPVFGVSSKILLGIAQAEVIVFEAEASFATSGGYGPNQVATLLGGATLLFVLSALQSTTKMHRLLFLGLAGALLLQSILTFSRGGVYSAVLGILALMVHFVLRPNQAARLFPLILAVGLVFWFVVLPRADTWTGGMLTERFQSIDPARRQQLARSDLELFQENPVLGVGPGMAAYQRRDLSIVGLAAHTEVTRAISEHGSLGVLSTLCLLVACGLAYFRAPTPGTRAWVASITVWAIANTMTAAMRLSLVPVCLGLAFIDFSQLRSRRS